MSSPFRDRDERTIEIRVLHIDDAPDFTQMVAASLEHESDRVTVESAPNASEGLERIREQQFDCIVSDYDMPGQNGIELLETHWTLPRVDWIWSVRSLRVSTSMLLLTPTTDGALIDDLLKLARNGTDIDDIEAVELASITETYWQNVQTAEATLTVEADRGIKADEPGQQSLEKLLGERNRTWR